MEVLGNTKEIQEDYGGIRPTYYAGLKELQVKGKRDEMLVRIAFNKGYSQNRCAKNINYTVKDINL